MADEENAAGDAPTESTSLQPPTYSGIRRELKAARSTGSTLTCCDTLCVAITGTICATFVLALLTIIPILLIVVGAQYINDCPRERYIPIWLIVLGAFGVLAGLTIFIRRLVAHCRYEEEITWGVTPCDGIVGIFVIVWFVCGTVWVFSIYNDFSMDPASQDYCNLTLYDVSFAIVAIVHMLFLAIGMVCCCVRVCFAATFDPLWDMV